MSKKDNLDDKTTQNVTITVPNIAPTTITQKNDIATDFSKSAESSKKHSDIKKTKKHKKNNDESEYIYTQLYQQTEIGFGANFGQITHKYNVEGVDGEITRKINELQTSLGNIMSLLKGWDIFNSTSAKQKIRASPLKMLIIRTYILRKRSTDTNQTTPEIVEKETIHKAKNKYKF